MTPSAVEGVCAAATDGPISAPALAINSAVNEQLFMFPSHDGDASVGVVV
jgi:hypothetical protein